MIYYRLLYFFAIIVLIYIAIGQEKEENKYIGTKACTMCHKTERQGKQLDIWQKSSHANAYKTLTSEVSEKIAKEKGLKQPAYESSECLSCHATGYDVDPKLLGKGFDIKDGVQCETCHGAGSNYKPVSIMRDREKAIAAGMRAFRDSTEIEKFCKTCHNEKSPTFKQFKFKEAWEKIKHPIPNS